MRNPCCDKEGTNKGAWSKQEDLKLIDYIKANGEGCWRSLPKSAGLQRCGKSCRLRWINYLRPDIKRGNFGQDEDDLIIKLHALLGNRWSLIAGRLPGRTDNEVKNYWNSHLRKKLIKMGVDPNNHRLNKNHITVQAQLPMVNHGHHDQQKPSTALSTEKATKESSCNTSALKSSAAERVNSDVASSLDDETARDGSFDLNLDLTIAFPSHPKLMDESTSTQGRDNNNQLAKEMEIIGNSNIDFSSPTLILFR